MHGGALLFIAGLLSYNLYLKCDAIIFLAFLFTWILMIFIAKDITKLSFQDHLVWKYLKDKEETNNKEKEK